MNMLTTLDKYNWPYNQDYFQSCTCCNVVFLGPKKALRCWECLPLGEKNLWNWDHEVITSRTLRAKGTG